MEPASVAKDLPPLVATLRKHSLEVPMVTTDIADADTPFAEDILKASAALGIRNYRFGAFKWGLTLVLLVIVAMLVQMQHWDWLRYL